MLSNTLKNSEMKNKLNQNISWGINISFFVETRDTICPLNHKKEKEMSQKIFVLFFFRNFIDKLFKFLKMNLNLKTNFTP